MAALAGPESEGDVAGVPHKGTGGGGAGVPVRAGWRHPAAETEPDAAHTSAAAVPEAEDYRCEICIGAAVAAGRDAALQERGILPEVSAL